jgi:osmotically-inducible protein OsmY
MRRAIHLTALALAALAAAPAACYRPAPNVPAAVPSPAEQEAAEARLAEQVRARLLAKLGDDAQRVDVVVRGDRVLLTGAVEERATQGLAQEVAKSVSGVREVDNKIGLVPRTDGPAGVGRAAATTGRELSDADLETQIKSRLVGAIGAHALKLEVEATDGVVSLRGWLPDAARERTALDIARGVRGVERVIDLIRIGLEEE